MLGRTEQRATAVGSTGALDVREMRLKARSHPWRLLGAAVVAVVVGFIVWSFADSDLEWQFFREHLTAPQIMAGLRNTVWISFLAMALGLALGVMFAVMRLSSNPVTASVAWFYVWLFRGTPVYLQLLIWYNLALVFPELGIPGLGSARTVEVISPFVAALLGLGINEGAYLTEIIRGGIISVDRGQEEAAQALCLSRRQRMRHITLPQALPAIVPAIGNEAVGMLKTSSLAAAISFSELLNGAQTIYFRNGAIIELLFVASVWYLVVVSLTSAGQYFLERSLARRRGLPTRPLVPQRVRALIPRRVS